MRFTLSSTALCSRLQTLARVINSKNSLPILDSFLFEVHDQQIFITASDSENVMKSSLALDECDGEGSFAVPNRTLLDAVKELAEQPLTFDVNTDNYTITIAYQNGVYKFTAQNAAEYPRVQERTSGRERSSQTTYRLRPHAQQADRAVRRYSGRYFGGLRAR